MGHHMPCLPVEVELASQGVPYAMRVMQHYGAPHALLATFVSPKNHSSSCSSLSSPSFKKQPSVFQEPCIPFGVCDYPATKNNHSLSKILCSFSHPLASVLHCIRMLKERSGILGRKNRIRSTELFDGPDQCHPDDQVGVERVVFFPDRSCPNRHPHAEPDAESAVYE